VHHAMLNKVFRSGTGRWSNAVKIAYVLIELVNSSTQIQHIAECSQANWRAHADGQACDIVAEKVYFSISSAAGV